MSLLRYMHAWRTFMSQVEPYSLYVRQPTNVNVTCEEKTRSPHPCVVCTMQAVREEAFRQSHCLAPLISTRWYHNCQLVCAARFSLCMEQGGTWTTRPMC